MEIIKVLYTLPKDNPVLTGDTTKPSIIVVPTVYGDYLWPEEEKDNSAQNI